MNTLIRILGLCCFISLAVCKPVHMRQKRATLAETVGDLTAAQSGIINENAVPLPNCKQIYDNGFTTSGVYRVNVGDNKGEFSVFCDMTLWSGGWTIIQRRVDNTTSFNRNRKEYNIGFGDFNGNFWLGLEKIKRLTDYETFELYIGLESFLTGTTAHLGWSKYGSFSLGTDANDYKLSISNYDTTSSAGDAFEFHDGEFFSTPDEDNDSGTSHCGSIYSSGWWYHNCHDSHLNGVYYWNGVHPTATFDGIIWEDFTGNTNSLKTVVMAVRPAPPP